MTPAQKRDAADLAKAQEIKMVARALLDLEREAQAMGLSVDLGMLNKYVNGVPARSMTVSVRRFFAREVRTVMHEELISLRRET